MGSWSIVVQIYTGDGGFTFLLTKLKVVLTPQLINQIAHFGELRRPIEACGVLIPEPYKGSQVFELPNRSLAGTDRYEMSTHDIQLILQGWFETTPRERWDEMVVWHTHPGGNIGPSRGDMQNRHPDLTYLVVTLTETGPVASWF